LIERRVLMATTARALPVVAALLAVLGTGRSLLAQNAEADEVKRVIRERRNPIIGAMPTRGRAPG
jgi:hypothetical protein